MTYEKSAGVIPFAAQRTALSSYCYTVGWSETLTLLGSFLRAARSRRGRARGGRTRTGEETKIESVALLPDFRDQVEYAYRRGGRLVQKTVVFFIGEIKIGLPSHRIRRPESMRSVNEKVDGSSGSMSGRP